MSVAFLFAYCRCMQIPKLSLCGVVFERFCNSEIKNGISCKQDVFSTCSGTSFMLVFV